jgi:hypothetical protein
MRPGALVVIAALAGAVSGCAGAPATGTPDLNHPSSPADPAAHARAEADRLIGLVRVPAKARPADHSPAHGLDQPAETTATDDIADDHRWWTVSADAQTTVDWLTQHGFAHHKPDGTGTSGGPAGVTAYELTFSDRAPAGIDSEELLFSVAPLPDGTAGIRADAQVVWLPNRAPDESIPSTIEKIDVSAFTMAGRIGHRVLTGAHAHHLATRINALPTAARTEHSCTADQGYRLHVVAGPLVFDEDVACFTVLVTDGGRRLPALNGSRPFVHAVASSMGLPDYPAAQPNGKPSPAAR